VGLKLLKDQKVLALDNSSSEEALKHAITFIERSTGEKIDTVVFL